MQIYSSDIEEIAQEKAPKKPVPKIVQLENIPVELKKLDRWCLWKYELRQNKIGKWKWTKVPYQANRKFAKSNDSKTWGSFESIATTYLSNFKNPDGTARLFPRFDGIGFFLSQSDSIIGIDGDHVIEPTMTAEAQGVIDSVNSYTEISPSGTGIRIFCKGKLPEQKFRKGNWEIYSDVRFLTITGDRIESTPDSIEERQEAVSKFHGEFIFTPFEEQKKKERGTFKTAEVPITIDQSIELICKALSEGIDSDLWNGSIDRFVSHSQADWNLVCEIVRLSGRDPAKIDSVFRLSGLCQESDRIIKWNRLGETTIEKALEEVDEIYNWEHLLHEQTVSNWICDWSTKSDAPRSAFGTPYEFRPISSADFAAAKYKVEWLIQGVVVKGQPTIVGGPKKALKTSMLIDMVTSLGSGTPFLGKFPVNKTRVALISGESGEYTIQETAKRICRAKGIDLASVDCWWDFRLPKLSVAEELSALSYGLKNHGIEAAVIDPLYLCLLSGGTDIQAQNLFDMGPLLCDVARACLDAGCMPILTHHSKKGSNQGNAPLDLEDLAFAGIQEFARQWLLLSRRKDYDPGTGSQVLPTF